MPVISTQVECPVQDSFRVQQIGGLFDVPITQKVRKQFKVEIPGADQDWKIGLITGPSGSGKSTVAKAAFGDNLYAAGAWPAGAVIDCFGDLPIKQIVQALTAVGFSSPPSWIKPYAVLSNGERFRCDLAKSLLSDRPLVVFDEFTSVVDRTVAKIGAAAVAKAIRSGQIDRRFVAVSCHDDIAEWLEPDWVVNMATCELARGRLHRPQIQLEIVRCERSAWKLFKNHHYLSADLHQSATCFLATWNGEPASFCAMLHQFGWKDFFRVSRIVSLPDYQGIGIGTRVMEACCQIMKSQGKRVSVTASHPAIIRHCERSALWRIMAIKKTGNNKQTKAERDGWSRKTTIGRAVAAFEYLGHK